MPPTASPHEKPQNIALTATPRIRAGAYSAISVTAFGIAAPRPSPVRKRKAVSASIDCACADTMLHAPKHATDSTSTVLRPSRSAQGPAASAPMPSPASAALITGPSALRAMPQSWVSAGAIKPIAAVS
jgi:hypothetical protein